ncbi:hypothetical protein [Xenorhabdus littoralis]|uniref:hypothetical protein n=1 Tax=Xenorhabdus littoralis TaxID=2582835 RepID=UPI0029E80ACA|nr:hypothetical protein [Xenorhabdus sp. psl]MDX7993231.1 hypothetical protein [Xenorhabdus sp. psl]
MKILTNYNKSLFVCLNYYAENNLQNREVYHHITLPSFMDHVSNTIRQREFAKQYILMSLNKFINTNDIAINNHCSVSHGRQVTALLLNNIPEISYIGIDIEYIYYHRKARHFMINYLQKYKNSLNSNTDKVYLSIVVFCCMESIYKALLSFCSFTFNIDDYKLEKIDSKLCTFLYIGNQVRIKTLIIHCYYYNIDDSIIAITLMNNYFSSVLDGTELII